MALSTQARKKLQNLVQQSKKLLFGEFMDQLQQYYGIRTDGTILMVEELASNEADTVHTARLLRERISYIKANLADKQAQDSESINQLIREQAFTILNRLIALRMAEERGIIKESIRLAYNSEGFQVYDSVTGQGQTSEIFLRYKWYLYAIFDELALDLPSMFDRFSPYAMLFPSEKAMTELLRLINDEGISLFREEGEAPINLWQADETVGWIYQYYNSKEEIKELRNESDAPRNSRELAVRNQFFTPRYVVQFLTDNSLGRFWYDMTQGRTILKELCPYLITGIDEVFLQKGQLRQEEASEDLQYIEHSPIKDPREIKVLDPACGSMHFGLYAFDLLEHIYKEAWDNHKDLLTDLRNSITRQEFLNQVPELIIRHNIHGVDIDPRALQIAGLSLWLRAQKSFNKMDLKIEERPQITKSNLVLAEAMPGNTEILNEIVKPLDGPIKELALHVWDLMNMSGETGLLLQIDKELDEKIDKIIEGLQGKVKNAQLQLGDDDEKVKIAQAAQKHGSKLYRDEFLDNAESRVINVLKEIAEVASSQDAYQKLLFADDTVRGFAFVELSRKKYDVILMNPPFGTASILSQRYIKKNYPTYSGNLACAFIERSKQLIDTKGFVASIYDRVLNINSSYEDFRRKHMCGYMYAVADTGWEVLDANVETTCTVFTKGNYSTGSFIDLLNVSDKENVLYDRISNNRDYLVLDSNDFVRLPNAVIGYYFPDWAIKLFNKENNLLESGLTARQGHALAAKEHFKLFWEVLNSTEYHKLYNGSDFSLFYLPYRDIVIYGSEGKYVRNHKSLRWSNGDYQLLAGVGFGRRGDILDTHVLKSDTVFTSVGLAFPDLSLEDSLILLSYTNSILSQYLVNLYSGQHKQAGYVNLIPMPSFECFNEKSIYRILEIKRKWFSLDETCLEFRHLLSYFTSSSLKEAIRLLNEELLSDKQKYKDLIAENDNFWINKAKLSKDVLHELNEYKSKRPAENLLSIDGLIDEKFAESSTVIYEIVSSIIGCAFGRWDIRSIKDLSLIPSFEGFFDPLPFEPAVSLKKKPHSYPIDLPLDGILVEDGSHIRSFSRTVEKVIFEIWEDNAPSIISDIEELGNFQSLEEFLNCPNAFFDYHLTRYTKSRREAPIYWPLSTQSGSYTVWVYYSRLNDQTLFKIVNDYIVPKQDAVLIAIQSLENNQHLDKKGKESLLQKRDFLHELQEFENELLRIARLPYQPNQNDGVLVNAAPLYKLFRHIKWRNSTEICWKQLEEGSYDWTHLAFSIWPERVRKKCKKDLNLAVIHGLEELCEIKPKEKKAKKKRKPKEIKKDPQLKIVE